MQKWGGAWFCPNSMRQTLLTSHGSPYPLGGMDGGGHEEEVEGEGGGGGELCMECKMNFKSTLKLKNLKNSH